MHQFHGQWITDEEFYALMPREVYSRQLERSDLDCSSHRDRHILFRRSFTLDALPSSAILYFSADDTARIYLNGRFVTQGPCPGYPFRYPYRTLDVTEYLVPGRNVLSVHTLYQGLINRVWQSGDLRHGLLLDLEAEGQCLLCSDETFLTHPHTGFREIGTVGYDTAFLECCDSRARELGFELPDFDDSYWKPARIRQHADYTLIPEPIAPLEYESILPVRTEATDRRILLDFGSNYAATLSALVRGQAGTTVTVRCAQELDGEGNPRFDLRANCRYEETWILGDGESRLFWLDYKSFRYCELLLPPGAQFLSAEISARHYPFAPKASLAPAFAADPALSRIWELCLHTLHYGAQEGILDCMEREKGHYLGDGCYTTLTHASITGDPSLLYRLIDDAFASSVITPGLVTCLSCSFMQEIAEFPLILVETVEFSHRLFPDLARLRHLYPKVTDLLETYRQSYEKDGLLRDLDKWCVVEWPANFRHGYDVDLTEGQICRSPHVAIQSYYLCAIRAANRMAALLDLSPYRDEAPLLADYYRAFFDEEQGLFRDRPDSAHASLVGNIFPFAFGLCPTEAVQARIGRWIEDSGMHSVSMFGAFAALQGFARLGDREAIRQLAGDPEAWLRMLDEGATTTFESWSRDGKWNTSLFHMTLSCAALFLSDRDLRHLFSL